MIAFVFPGQGAQYVGMGKELAGAHPEARAVFTAAGDALGFDVAALCWDGPDELLRQTEHTQPAILTASLACLAVVGQRGWRPAITAGLSLGEYTALVCAQSLQPADAVRVVRQRGRFMAEAAPGRATAMAAILGLDGEAVERICTEAGDAGVVEPANFNSPGQIVIAGDEAAVRRAIGLAKTAGARRAVELPVGAPFHTSLMRPAADRLAEVLEAVPLRAAAVPVVSNVTARPVQDPDDIRRLLVAQVASPVRWDASVAAMAAAGVTTFVEVGPGTTLSGLIRRTVPGAVTVHVEDRASLDDALRTLETVEAT